VRSGDDNPYCGCERCRISVRCEKGAATTDANGIYQFGRSTLSPGIYDLVASKSSYVTQTKAKISVTGDAVTYVNFFLQQVSLMGQVRQAGTGENLAGATVAAYLGSATTPNGTGTADANGIYQIGGLATGTYTVIASKSGYVKQTRPGISFTAAQPPMSTSTCRCRANSRGR